MADTDAKMADTDAKTRDLLQQGLPRLLADSDYPETNLLGRKQPQATTQRSLLSSDIFAAP